MRTIENRDARDSNLLSRKKVFNSQNSLFQNCFIPSLHEQIKEPAFVQVLDPYEVTLLEIAQIRRVFSCSCKRGHRPDGSHLLMVIVHRYHFTTDG